MPDTENDNAKSALDSSSQHHNLFALIKGEIEDAASEAADALVNANVSCSSLIIIERDFSKLLSEYKDAWSNVRLSLTQVGQDESEKQAREYRVDQRSYTRTLISLNDKISVLRSQNPAPPPGPTPGPVQLLPSPKFSQVEITVFDGNITQWPAFWDSFKSLVHVNSNIADVVKFALLRKYLSGRAFKVIEGLPVTNSNYGVAINALKTTFQAPNRLLSRLMREFDDLVPPHHKYDELFYFKLEIDRSVAQIKHLSQESPDGLLFREIILKKLPAETFKALFNEYHTPTPTYKQISEGLMDIIQCMDLCQQQPRPEKRSETVVRATHVTAKHQNVPAQNSVPKHNSQSNSSSNQTIPVSTVLKYSHGNTSSAEGKKQSGCLFCGQAHSSKYCPQYTTLDARRTRVQNLNLCFCCLKPGH